MDELQFQRYLLDSHGLQLNPQQWEAVTHNDGPLLLLAVPGSGKTTVVVCRCAYLCLCRGVDPRRILTVTFNKAAQLDMQQRARRLFGDSAGAARFSTIHAFCYGVLKEYGTLVGREVPRLFEDERPRLLRRLYAEQNGGEYLSDDALDALANRIGFVKNALWTDAQIAKGPHDIQGFPALFAAYERWKNENGCMDFDDMLDKALSAFKVRPQLLEAARRRYDYIHVDEAQDTSALQHTILSMVAQPVNNLMLVGDEDQSIYGFRAADPKHLLDFQKLYPDGRLLRIETNYRSAEPVLRAAGALIGHNKARHAKALQGVRGEGAAVRRTTLPDSADLCPHIVARLQALHGTTAVLFRENSSAVPLMDALDRAGISFAMREHRLAFFEHWVVRDILDYLRLSREPRDLDALRRVYFRLGAWLTRAQMEDAAARASGCADVFEALLGCQGLREGAAKRLGDLRGKFRKLAALPPGKAVAYVLKDMGYADALRRAAGGEGAFAESLLHRAESLRGIAEHTGSYEDFLARMEELPLVARRAASLQQAAVTLSTVHSAKGLEFDHVLVTDLFEGRFPSLGTPEDPAAVEEERRLFYVAVTRARDTLEVVTASRIHGEPAKPSRFLKELQPPARILPARKTGVSSASAHAQALPGGLCMGAAVRHRSFGRGEVTGVDAAAGQVCIRFAKYGEKTFDAGYSLEQGILQVEA